MEESTKGKEEERGRERKKKGKRKPKGREEGKEAGVGRDPETQVVAGTGFSRLWLRF